ncbi:hypothetical protein LSO07_19085 [Janthinobacterium sp. PLB04]|uniref:Uncharacterized protein n=1 Tax=Janthinobacterium lividum TaxID=29581 RepID=A0AAJ4MPM2_9BURK|nr:MULTISPECIES: hypothetical protein [Janthinobacterium]KAB0325674.1 hypothetical protein F3B38_18800 [Janthinobacterium lividum]QSX94784.1 hypothetical protein J3P46_18955 [Janthinobacterium lividum]UGQ34597.1 hypothetical protein LSO07_19085 [Janthinobacterium sp. PLB04]
MADKFYDGMPNVNEKLNEMDRAFAAGPYNALPLTGGNLSGPIVSFSSLAFVTPGAPAPGDAPTMLRGAAHQGGTSPSLVAALGVGGTNGLSYQGQFRWYTSSGRPTSNGTYTCLSYDLRLRAIDVKSNLESADLMVISGAGDLAVRGTLSSSARIVSSAIQVGPIPAMESESIIGGIDQSQGKTNLRIPNSTTFYVSAGAMGSASACSVSVNASTNTGRSINVSGTINAGGADYAEYIFKSPACGIVAAGQVIGIGADGQLTDRWVDAISFAVKSTDPCMVGGDKWSQQLGPRPASVTRTLDSVESQLVSEAQAAIEAVYDGLTLLTPAVPAKAAVYREVPLAGDTDEEWAARQAPGLVFDAALEALRKKVDRIAFAGQVPCNVVGAVPGQFIVPVQQGEGITGIPVNEDELTLKQYMRAIGKVIATEDDGRARVIVKVA